MIRQRAAGCVLALWSLTACQPEELPQDFSHECDSPAFVTGLATSAGSYDRFHEVGPVREPFESPIRPFCVRNQPSLWGEVTVTAPDGFRIPARLENPSGPNQDRTVDVVFDATTHGWHRVELLYKPTGTALTRDLLIGRRFAATAVLSVPGPCHSLQRTSLGAWICGDRVIRKGVDAMTLPAGNYFVAGRFVWSVSPSRTRIERYEDVGTGELILRNSAELPSLSRRSGVGAAATEQELILREESNLFWFAVQPDGTVQQRGHRTAAASRDQISRVGDLVLTSAGQAAGSELVAYRLLPSGEIENIGVSDFAFVISSDGSGLWGLDQELFYAVPDAVAGSVRLASTRLPENLGVGGYTIGSNPTYRYSDQSRGAVFVREKSELVLETLPSASIVGVTHEFAWGQDENGNTQIFLR